MPTSDPPRSEVPSPPPGPNQREAGDPLVSPVAVDDERRKYRRRIDALARDLHAYPVSVPLCRVQSIVDDADFALEQARRERDEAVAILRRLADLPMPQPDDDEHHLRVDRYEARALVHDADRLLDRLAPEPPRPADEEENRE